ncbi:hypothetical protein [Acetobacter oeni]|uniref:Uncharacterized protein n=1 Tax=Acetobacter oeni TaxID=304077 RepID=A0A511XH56_9PROT|nr:hypothetical protein [Acetobacter oeni]MBB3882430.1 hypothetical protein [Acetobacter oeni]NHO18476.1 hypothetical protein [Acetobacter oeni]GBR00451.1 hypothetical protein AA21952_0103 [Acetobacter oeni LMG 21952]GEN62286.1 hypothetical protein AOE01nite_05100 [Acetobacter oeni]
MSAINLLALCLITIRSARQRKIFPPDKRERTILRAATTVRLATLTVAMICALLTIMFGGITGQRTALQLGMEVPIFMFGAIIALQCTGELYLRAQYRFAEDD